MTPPPDSASFSSADKDALIATLLVRIDELSKRLEVLEEENAALREKLPPKTPDNSSTPPAAGQKSNGDNGLTQVTRPPMMGMKLCLLGSSNTPPWAEPHHNPSINEPAVGERRPGRYSTITNVSMPTTAAASDKQRVGVTDAVSGRVSTS